MGPGHWRSAWRCWARRSSRLARLRRRCCAWPACTQKRSRCWRWICTIWWPAAVWRGFGGCALVHGLINLMPFAAPIGPAQLALEAAVTILRPALVAGQGAVVCVAPAPAPAVARPTDTPAPTAANGARRRLAAVLFAAHQHHMALLAQARAAGHYGGAGGHGAALGLGGQRAAAGGFMRRTPPQPCRGVFSFAARRAIRLTCAVAVLNPARTKGWVQ